jgi:hypothetical protein
MQVLFFHVHFSEAFHQQAVDDDIRHRRGAGRSGQRSEWSCGFTKQPD